MKPGLSCSIRLAVDICGQQGTATSTGSFRIKKVINHNHMLSIF